MREILPRPNPEQVVPIVPLIVLASSLAQPASHDAPPIDWKSEEAPVLAGHVQLTSRDDFIKAGEAYFSPDGAWIIFQAVPVPEAGAQPDPFYSMYVAKLVRDEHGKVTGLEQIERISPEGAANTCGWFHPSDPGRVLYGSTLTPPATDQRSGFQVGTRKYVWLFPQETEVVSQVVPSVAADMLASRTGVRAVVNMAEEAVRTAAVFQRPNYDAECSYSADGRFILYAHVRDEETVDRADADIWIYDSQTGEHHELVAADGYDGGPFFSPDGQRICYRSDRQGNDLLQVFVADLKFNAEGVPVAIENERQLTDNEHVNWGPYWHPSGSFLVYGTSELGHHNYEVFAIEAGRESLAAETPAASLRRWRITHADGADVLPVFSPDGGLMMWTSQRGPKRPTEDRPSSQLWIAEFSAQALREASGR